MSCDKCGGTGWIVRERNGISSVSACSCRKPLAISKPFEDTGTPLSDKVASLLTFELCETLDFAPDEKQELGRAAIALALQSMCETEAEADWTIKRACNLYRKWGDCGIPGLRQIVSSFRLPKDGFSMFSTPVFPDGLPPLKSLPPPPPLQLQLPAAAPPAPQISDAAPTPPAEYSRTHRDVDFQKQLEEMETWPADRDAIPPPRRIRQSEIISANAEPLDSPAPRPEGTYQKITRENFDELLRLEREKKAKDAAPTGETDA